MQVFYFLLQDRMCNFSKKIRQRKNCTRVEFEPSKFDGHSMVPVLLFFSMHKISTKFYFFPQSARYVQHYTGQCHYFEHSLEMKIYLSYPG